LARWAIIRRIIPHPSFRLWFTDASKGEMIRPLFPGS
jgi:hypothetical protein